MQGVALDMLGSQANENVLVEQPEALITQKARVKRNRRTEWDYYVQFRGFPEDEGAWYSARAIKTQHPRGAELIREFEHPDDAADASSPAAIHQQQAAQPAAVPFTQDAGPSQMHAAQDPYQSQNHQLYTQEQFVSQLQQPADVKPASSAMRAGFQIHGQSAFSDPDMLNTASQNDMQPALHWSFDRLQKAPHFSPQLLQRPFGAPQAQGAPYAMDSSTAHPVPTRTSAKQEPCAHHMPGSHWGQQVQSTWHPVSRPEWPATAPFTAGKLPFNAVHAAAAYAL